MYVGMLRLIGLYMHAGNKYVCSLNLLQHFDVKNKQTNEDLLLLHFLFRPQQTTTVKVFGVNLQPQKNLRKHSRHTVVFVTEASTNKTKYYWNSVSGKETETFACLH